MIFTMSIYKYWLEWQKYFVPWHSFTTNKRNESANIQKLISARYYKKRKIIRRKESDIHA